MIATVEVRWFRPGPIPEDVQIWFADLKGPVIRQPDRTDYYLRIPGDVSLGVKLREGRIEIKQQGSSFGLVLFQQGLVGKVDGWRKWQFDLGDPAEMFPAGAVDETCWFVVTKIRQLRSLRFRAEGNLEPVQPETSLTHGCDLEITQVEWDMRHWWTLAMEAYGPEKQLYENLTRTAGALFETPFPGSLQERDSLSYPGWLQAYSTGGGQPP